MTPDNASRYVPGAFGPTPASPGTCCAQHSAPRAALTVAARMEGKILEAMLRDALSRTTPPPPCTFGPVTLAEPVTLTEAQSADLGDWPVAATPLAVDAAGVGGKFLQQDVLDQCLAGRDRPVTEKAPTRVGLQQAASVYRLLIAGERFAHNGDQNSGYEWPW